MAPIINKFNWYTGTQTQTMIQDAKAELLVVLGVTPEAMEANLTTWVEATEGYKQVRANSLKSAAEMRAEAQQLMDLANRYDEYADEVGDVIENRERVGNAARETAKINSALVDIEIKQIV